MDRLRIGEGDRSRILATFLLVGLAIGLAEQTPRPDPAAARSDPPACSSFVNDARAETGLLFACPLDLNRASAASLTSIPGIGARLSERIVADRPFDSVAALERVKGIGPKLIDRITPFVEVTSASR